MLATRQEHWEELTEAEQRVLPLVVDGLLYREIAVRLFVSRRTVEAHVASIQRKIGVRSRRDLALAYRTRYGSSRHAARCSGCGRPTVTAEGSGGGAALALVAR